jgi:hypothetical protein
VVDTSGTTGYGSNTADTGSRVETPLPRRYQPLGGSFATPARRGAANTSATTGYGSNTADTGYGPSGPGLAPNTAGPHKSDMVNKHDPRVETPLPRRFQPLGGSFATPAKRAAERRG